MVRELIIEVEQNSISTKVHETKVQVIMSLKRMKKIILFVLSILVLLIVLLVGLDFCTLQPIPAPPRTIPVFSFTKKSASRLFIFGIF
jgi:hypothetical protein